MNKLDFIFGYSVFLFFSVQMISIATIDLDFMENTPNYIVPPKMPTQTGWIAVFNIAKWSIENMGYFFQLMTISSTFTFLGTVLFAPFTIALVWIVIETIRGV